MHYYEPLELGFQKAVSHQVTQPFLSKLSYVIVNNSFTKKIYIVVTKSPCIGATTSI